MDRLRTEKRKHYICESGYRDVDMKKRRSRRVGNIGKGVYKEHDKRWSEFAIKPAGRF